MRDTIFLIFALALQSGIAQAKPLNASKIAAGRNHTCALTSDSGVACWGDGTRGQLGDGRNRNSSKPTRVVGLTGVRDIAAGGNHSCAILATGRVKCWGAGKDGQLGYGTDPGTKTSRDKNVPYDVLGLEKEDIVGLALGDTHTCALTARGSINCWGLGGQGQLGDGAGNVQPGIWHTLRSPSTSVLGILGQPKALAAGGNHTCARTATGDVFCWGVAALGQLGDGDRVGSGKTAVRADIRGVTTLDAGANHTCAIAAGALKCWGDATWGQLGDVGIGAKSFDSEPTPVEIDDSLERDVFLVATGRGHTCVAQNHNGTHEASCFGDRALMELGPENSRVWITPQSGDWFFAQRLRKPRPVFGAGSSVRAMVAGNKHTCTLDGIGNVRCWGHGFFGQLGNGSARESGTPQLVEWR